ncbi:MAG TPA: hypothetical protein VFG83_11070, partial [Kofleriaceae bacterium]|nr:hypothetical protein [Kofleriaceae bacterium]
DARLRGTVTLGHAIGRGTVGLRLAAGGTVIHEHAKPTQSGRSDAVTWQIVPAADLEATVAVGLFGAWGLMMTGGPSLSLDDGAIDGGWVASVGVTWQR